MGDFYQTKFPDDSNHRFWPETQYSVRIEYSLSDQKKNLLFKLHENSLWRSSLLSHNYPEIQAFQRCRYPHDPFLRCLKNDGSGLFGSTSDQMYTGHHKLFYRTNTKLPPRPAEVQCVVHRKRDSLGSLSFYLLEQTLRLQKIYLRMLYWSNTDGEFSIFTLNFTREQH